MPADRPPITGWSPHPTTPGAQTIRRGVARWCGADIVAGVFENDGWRWWVDYARGPYGCDGAPTEQAARDAADEHLRASGALLPASGEKCAREGL